MDWACGEKRVGRRAMENKVQGRRKTGKPRRRCLDKAKDGIKREGTVG